MALKNYPFPEGTDLYAVIQATDLQWMLRAIRQTFR